MDRMFQDFGRKLPAAGAAVTSFPAIDVHDTDKGLELTAELPGIAEKDIDVSVSDRTLTIKGEKTAEKTVDEKDRYVSERSYGSFRRVLTLPFEPDASKVEAHMDNGVLTVVLPRPAETAEKTKKIEVKRKG
ncbi:Hsp20/alpha crystallin family protein [Roseibium aggregatum]|uniref:Hsp20/alpha crystallin family protein n=1 Tax=Roseibium aggregatum TaxID=187304 RepID=A0A926S5H7_9HYPH|nr:Hsp20/alpha crystallin family protein [Roseibium aggregatum]MBD1546175.1 Hsp20/alpha crystallin family protein [Roseibium aggregatum]